MAGPKRTTVNLTRKALAVKERLYPGISLKGMLSVGLEMFDTLSREEQVSRVVEAMNEDYAEKTVADAEAQTVAATRKRGRPPTKSAG
ncbi:MAG: hypothetical protein ACYSUV_20485 [Planctomycetota bacterium]|jgi:hypothetical protein